MAVRRDLGAPSRGQIESAAVIFSARCVASFFVFVLSRLSVVQFDCSCPSPT